MFKKNNKGDLNGALAVVIIFMIMLIISFSLDVAKIQWQKFVINNQLTFVSKIAGRQGGILNVPPTDYDPVLIEKDTYNDTVSVWNAVCEELERAGIDSDTCKITIGGKVLPHESKLYDFKEEISVTIEAEIKNSFINHLFGGPEYVKIKDSVLVVSEKWYRQTTVLN